MQINFFDVRCKTKSNSKKFGLCDDPPPDTKPAYIDENDKSKWIAFVSNPSNKDVDFYAIDHCINILRPNGKMENRCDGMLHYDKNIIFVELKDRAYRGWLGDGIEQLTKSIAVFKIHNNISDYSVDAYISNKQRPISKSAHNAEIQKFKNDTGLILYVKQNINLK